MNRQRTCRVNDFRAKPRRGVVRTERGVIELPLHNLFAKQNVVILVRNKGLSQLDQDNMW